MLNEVLNEGFLGHPWASVYVWRLKKLGSDGSGGSSSCRADAYASRERRRQVKSNAASPSSPFGPELPPTLEELPLTQSLQGSRGMSLGWYHSGPSLSPSAANNWKSNYGCSLLLSQTWARSLAATAAHLPHFFTVFIVCFSSWLPNVATETSITVPTSTLSTK